MGVTIVIGGQFGSEGKGKVARFFAEQYHASSVVRVGGINSGHTTIDQSGHPVVFRTLPTAAIDQSVNCILPAGSYIDTNILFQEISVSAISLSQVKIHPNAVIISQKMAQIEKENDLRNSIGSTVSGTGAAVAMRSLRDKATILAKDVPELKPFICDTTDFLREELNHGHEVLIEGTQGYGLSNLYSPYYPYATSRDTTAAAFLSEAGLSPFDVKHIVMVLRSYPIRVGGNSGPLSNEISWDEVTALAKSHESICEYTSVTKTLRRVGLFDADIPLQAIKANQPDQIVLNHLDYIAGAADTISKNRELFIQKVQEMINEKINYIGLSPSSLYAV